MSDNVNIMAYLVCAADYGRMQQSDHSGVDDSMPYSMFITWNTKCINEMTMEDRAWLLGLCNRFKDNKVKLMDLESCVAFGADSFFFDQNKKLCIVNPR